MNVLLPLGGVLAGVLGWWGPALAVRHLPSRQDVNFTTIAERRSDRLCVAALTIAAFLTPFLLGEAPTDLVASGAAATMWVLGVGVVAAWVDLHTRLLPNRLTAAALLGGGALLTMGVAIGPAAGSDLRRALWGALTMGGFYLVLALIYPAGMGLGDVKLAPSLGAMLAWFGWAELIVGTFLGFVVGSIVGLAAVLTRQGNLRMNVPFGPSMIAGAWLGLFVGTPFARWYLGV